MLFWWLIHLFFVYSLGSVICKKYTNTNNKYSKYANVIDVSITGSCGGGRGGVSAGGLLVFLLSFFASFKIFSFNLFIYFSLPLWAVSTCLGSFVTFCDVLSIFILRYNMDPVLFLIQPGRRGNVP